MRSGSKPLSFEALAGPRVRIRDIDRVPSGSPATLHLSPIGRDLDVPGAALVLAGRGLSLRAARWVLRLLLDQGATVVALPVVESLAGVRAALAACGIEATAYGSPDRVDVRALRERLGLSQDEFALRFGLECASVRNWEQGRSEPDTATRSFLLMIGSCPEVVRRTLYEYGRAHQAAE